MSTHFPIFQLKARVFRLSQETVELDTAHRRKGNKIIRYIEQRIIGNGLLAQICGGSHSWSRLQKHHGGLVNSSFGGFLPALMVSQWAAGFFL